MPIFEYRCRGCGREFEAIVNSSSQPTCPGCDGSDLQKQLSVFAVGGPKAASADIPEACRSCADPRGPGACGMQPPD